MTKTRCPFFKTINNQTKMTSDKTYNKEDYTVLKIWDFSSMRLINKSTRNVQKGKV